MWEGIVTSYKNLPLILQAVVNIVAFAAIMDIVAVVANWFRADKSEMQKSAEILADAIKEASMPPNIVVLYQSSIDATLLAEIETVDIRPHKRDEWRVLQHIGSSGQKLLRVEMWSLVNEDNDLVVRYIVTFARLSPLKT